MNLDLSDPFVLEAARELDIEFPNSPIVPPVQFVSISMKKVLPSGWFFDESTQTYWDSLSGERITSEKVKLR